MTAKEFVEEYRGRLVKVIGSSDKHGQIGIVERHDSYCAAVENAIVVYFDTPDGIRARGLHVQDLQLLPPNEIANLED